jgi:hypothetical protein
VNSGWGIAECLGHIIDHAIQQALADCSFFSLTCDEVTTVDNQIWISIHVYVVNKEFFRLPYLLALERVEGGTGANNLTRVITTSLKGTGAMSGEDIRAKLLCFGADGASVFQGTRNGVTSQLTREFAPFLLGIHCCGHRLNLVVQSLAETHIVSGMEALLAALHAYFSKSPKKALEFSNLAEVMGTGGRKILKHCKTRWVGLLAPAKRVLSEYRLLVAKMAADYDAHAPARTLYHLLIDVKCLLSMAAIVPLFEKADSLMRFAQSQDVFVCDFVAAVQTLKL